MAVELASIDRPPSRRRFSVITVSYNAMRVLPETVKSMRGQSCKDYEWVVVDGASTDGSTAWLKHQAPDVLVSEPDCGIYDAMNKAVRAATGDWLFFLNAGDRFADEQVLANIATEIESGLNRAVPPALVYGDVVYFGERGLRRKRFNWLTRRNLIYGDLCHQATFVRRELFAQHGVFDVSLRYNADFDWFLRVFGAGAALLYVHRDIALFHDSGAHVVNRTASESERDVVRAKYCTRPQWLIGHWALRCALRLRRLVGEAT